MLTSLVNASNNTKFVSLVIKNVRFNLPLINLYPNEYSLKSHYYLFAVKLERCVGSWTLLMIVLVKHVFQAKQTRVQHDYRNKWIKNINQAYTCKCKYKLDKTNDLIQINGGIIVNIEGPVKNIMFGILLHIIVKRKYIRSIIYDSMIMCDEAIDSDDKKVNFNEKKSVCKMQNVYFLLDFLLITIALWIAVSINCYSIQYW